MGGHDLGALVEDNELTTYNYSEISYFEFESLCRDLLQAELGISLEIFAPGQDRGIDIRYIGEDENEDSGIVGQCKRWAEDSDSSLLYHLKTVELPKVQRLAPQRYILMTSVKMTVQRKDEIVAALHPWIKTPKDVMGKDDIDGLLARHPAIERRHIKLWLTSTEVLDALINSGITNRSEAALDSAKTQLRLWVPNPSFNRTIEILEDDHVCVISGAPGIGKSMLADILVVNYAARGYQNITISKDIDEGDRAWRSKTRQIFHFDDFLGEITYGQLRLGKNEESRLARFFERVRNDETKRFILTTREYVLSEAVQRYERLSNVELENSKHIVSLDDYTRLIRANILYNHLFFSNLPRHLKNALLPERRYWDVINHSNYNPRVIEHAVSLTGVDSLSPDEFVSNIFETLNKPTEVWNRIFQNLPETARRILLAIASLPTGVLLKDVQDVVKSLSPNDFDPSEFMNSIGMIEGTFIDLSKVTPSSNNRQRVVTVRDPSVRDYLWARLEQVDIEADALLERAVFFEQCVVLYEGSNHVTSIRSGTRTRERIRDVVDRETLAARAVELIYSPAPGFEMMWNGVRLSVGRTPMNLERRTTFLLKVLTADPTNQVVAAATNKVLSAAIHSWEAGKGSLRQSLELLKQATETKGLLSVNLLTRTQRGLVGLITSRGPDKEGFEVIVGLSKLNPLLLTEHEFNLESWSSEFEDFLDCESERLLKESDDPDILEQEMWEFGRIATGLGTDITHLEAEVDARIEELRTGWVPDDEDELRDLVDDADDDGDDKSEIEEIDDLFQSLR